MRKLLLTAGAIAVLVVPAAAQGAEVHVAVYTPTPGSGPSAKFLSYTGGPGEQNRVTVDAISGQKRAFRVVDEGAPLTTGAGCTRVSDHEATCRGPVYAQVDLGDQNDDFRVRTLLPTDLFAGRGDDTVVTAGGRDTLNGGGGNDVLRAGAGDDRVTDGDYAMTGVGPDTLDGGPGHDSVDYELRNAPVSVDLTASGPQGEPGEGDTLTGFEDASVSSAGDRLVGDSGPNELQSYGSHGVVRGGAGNDYLEADWGGRDVLSGGPGNDYLRLLGFLDDSGDKIVPDKISCGGGRDLVSYPLEQQYVPPDCEIVDYDSFDDPIYYPRASLATSRSQIVKIVPQGCGRLDIRNGRCHLTWAMRERAPGGSTRGPLLARREQTFPKDAEGGVVALRLTPAGRRVLRRRHGLYARIGNLRGNRIRDGFVMRLRLR